MNTRHVPPPPPVPGPLCAVYSPRLPLLGTHALAREEEASLREHLAGCAWCQHQHAAYSAAEAALRRQYASSPAAKPLTLEDIMRASDYDTRPVRPSRPNNRDDLYTSHLPDRFDQSGAPRRGSGRGGQGPRGPRPWVAVAAVAAVLLLVGLAASLFASQRPQTPGSTPPASGCAALLPNAAAAAPVTSFSDVTYPNGAVTTPLASSYGGASQFTILQADVCYSGSADALTGPASDHQSVTAKLLGAGWAQSPTFPTSGDLLQPCSGQCYALDNTHYLALQRITDHGSGVFTYHLQLAAPPAAPKCNSNFANSPIKGVQTAVEGVPLPPITYVVPDDAANLHGYDLCSSGSVTSISAFLAKALPADGWAKGTDRRCFYNDECWLKGSAAISWSVGDPTDWHIAYHPMAG